ncbi:IclR family transcriptional regulator [Streptomyces typhae]|uniref:IclR family transcriptional regulator n=1 Tax=Streptomyces typhae TaxID=2681492 RepID=UPI0018DFCE11|nr:helix-turn-helix domain-containing protein [Streptomyces typhae]
MERWGGTRSGGEAGAAAGRGVLEGAFGLLEELARVGEAGLTELAARTGLPKTTAHRLLGQLGALGAVEQHRGRYRVGATVARLGQSWTAPRLWERRAAAPLRHLALETRATVCVAVPSTGRTTVVTGIAAAAREFFPHLPGQTLPPDSAADVVFAAAGPSAEPPPDHTPNQWARRLRGARERGADLHQYEWGGERLCLAVPVRARSGEIVAAVGVAVPDPRRIAHTTEVAQRSARMLSKAIGSIGSAGT